MGSFPESELGGGANDTALGLGGPLGSAALGRLLAAAY
jgi:hypothetical protein